VTRGEDARVFFDLETIRDGNDDAEHFMLPPSFAFMMRRAIRSICVQD